MKGKAKIKTPRSKRAGTIFPVGRIARHLRNQMPHMRLGSGAPVYLSAVLEYLSAEVLELAANSARDNRKKRIRPRDVRLAVGHDTELSKLCQDVTFSEGGNMVHINVELLPSQVSKTNKAGSTRKSSAIKVVGTAKKSKRKLHVASPSAAKATSKASATSASCTSSGKASQSSTLKAVSHPMLPVLSEGRLFLGQKLFVVMGDISLINSEAIVHPTNATYSTSGQVGQVLSRAGGLLYKTALDSLKAAGNLPTCGVSMSDMYNIEAAKIIHCNSPSWSKSNGIADLQKSVENCFKIADKEHIKSIALPSIGSGNAGWPKQLAAETILRAIERYFQTIMASSIKNVYFVLYDQDSVDIYTSELKKLLEHSYD